MYLSHSKDLKTGEHTKPGSRQPPGAIKHATKAHAGNYCCYNYSESILIRKQHIHLSKIKIKPPGGKPKFDSKKNGRLELTQRKSNSAKI